MGTWWEEADFVAVCKRKGLQCTFHQQPSDLYNAAFRFDVTIH